MPTSQKAKRRLMIGLGAVAGIAVLVLAGTWLFINVFSDDAPDPFSLDDDPAVAAPDESVDLDGTWQVAGDSEAGYRVDEVLNGMDNTVVGRTNEITGEVTIADGTATSAEIVVDMASVTTDSNSRDGQFQGSIMRTDDYPTSTFTLTEQVPVADLPSAATALQVTARGELTIRDVTREVVADLEMLMSGDTVRVAGSIPVEFADFGIDPPNLAFVRVEDDGLVEFLLTFVKD